MKKETIKEKMTQKKLTESWKQLPDIERKNLLLEEERKRRFELREIKINIWKKWRGKEEKSKKKGKENQVENMTKTIERIDEILEIVKRENEDRKVAQEREIERRKTIMKEKNKKEMERKIKESEKIERKKRKKIMEEKWEMIRWVTDYIDINTDRWEKEKKERQEKERLVIADWERMSRLEKIRKIKEKEKMKNDKERKRDELTTTSKEKGKGWKTWRKEEQQHQFDQAEEKGQDESPEIDIKEIQKITPCILPPKKLTAKPLMMQIIPPTLFDTTPEVCNPAQIVKIIVEEIILQVTLTCTTPPEPASPSKKVLEIPEEKSNLQPTPPSTTPTPTTPYNAKMVYEEQILQLKDPCTTPKKVDMTENYKKGWNPPRQKLTPKIPTDSAPHTPQKKEKNSQKIAGCTPRRYITKKTEKTTTSTQPKVTKMPRWVN
jgi:hypothetical protein